jgi:hypothetical protein
MAEHLIEEFDRILPSTDVVTLMSFMRLFHTFRGNLSTIDTGKESGEATDRAIEACETRVHDDDDKYLYILKKGTKFMNTDNHSDKVLIKTPFRHLRTLKEKQNKASLILQNDDMFRGLILFVWQIYRKDVPLANLWNEITLDFVERWKDRCTRIGNTDDIDAEDYYGIIREEGIPPDFESFY